MEESTIPPRQESRNLLPAHPATQTCPHPRETQKAKKTGNISAECKGGIFRAKFTQDCHSRASAQSRLLAASPWEERQRSRLLGPRIPARAGMTRYCIRVTKTGFPLGRESQASRLPPQMGSSFTPLERVRKFHCTRWGFVKGGWAGWSTRRGGLPNQYGW